MPHFILEYSSNLAGQLDVPALFRALHTTAVATGVFPLAGIRFRAARRDEYLIADGNPENAFVHLSLKMGHGRSLAVRKTVGEAIFASLCAQLDSIYQRRPLGISFEMQELTPDLNYKKNNMHDRLK